MMTASGNAQNTMSVGQHMFSPSTASSAMNDWYRYLGPPTNAVRPSPYDRQQYTNFDLPEAYKGRNLFLRDTIDNVIFEDIEWYTTVALPWSVTDQEHVQMNTWEFNAQLAGRVPAEGISRLITSSKRQFREHVVRRGLAFIMEIDYLGTPEGDFQFSQNIAQISQSVQETQNHDTVIALLTCKDYKRHWMERFGQVRFSWVDIIEEEILNFAAVQRDSKRLSLLFEHHKRLLMKQGVKPDLLIMWPGAQIYLSMVPPAETSYYLAGPSGVAQYRKGPTSIATFRPGTPDAVNVFETRDFDVYHDAPPIQLLTRPIQVSEHYGMVFGEWRNDEIYDYQSRHRDIVLYDENMDNYSKISFRTAFRNSYIFEEDGGYHKFLQDLVNDYRNRPNPVQEERGNDETVGFRPHFLTTPNDDGVYELIEYWGQMNQKAADVEDFRQVAETIIACVFPNGIDEVSSTWQDMIDLINQIENQGYNHEYFRRLIEENLPYNLDENGTFVGELTPNAASMGWGQRLRLKEWTPNSTGSLRLPDGTKLDVDFPAGFANGPGLRTIAKEAQKPNSAWRLLGQRVERIINMLNRFVATLINIFPSEVLSEQNMPPWFHRADALTTFFSNVISINRDPIWMAALPVERDVEGNILGQTFGKTLREQETITDDSISWYPVPMFVLQSQLEYDALRNIYDGKIPDDVAEAATKSSPGDRENTFVFKSPITGNPVTVNSTLMRSATMLPKEIRAMLLMGQDTLPMLYDILDNVSPKSQRKLLAFIYIYSSTKTFKVADLRSIIRGISVSSEQEAVIDIIYVDSTSNKSQKTQAKKKFKEFTDLYRTISETEQDIAAIPEGINPPKAITQWGKEEGIVEKNSMSFSRIREDLDRMLEINGEIAALRASYAPDDEIPAFGFGVTDTANYLAPGLGGEDIPNSVNATFAELSKELTTLAGRVDARLREVFGNEEEEKRNWKDEALRRRKAAQKKLAVQDDEDAAVRSTFYRAPLTMSLTMLESLATFGAGAYVRPSDPASGHLRPYVLYSASSETAVLDEALWERPQYAGISTLLENPTERKLEHTTPLMRISLRSANGHESEITDANDDDDDDVAMEQDEEFDTFEQAFGRSSRVEPIGERLRRPEKWTKSTLRTGSSKYDVRLPGTEYYQMLSDTFVYRWRQANEETKPLLRAAMQVFMFSKCNREKYWLRMIDNNIHVLVNLLLWRLQIDHDMASMILMKGGLETGANLFGHSNFVISNDGISKIIYGNYTFNSKAMVWKERNVHLIENVKAEGYNGGRNTQFIKWGTHNITMADQNVDRPSILVTAISIKENTFPKYMQFSSVFTPGWVNREIDNIPRYYYSSAEYYDRLWQISKIRRNGDQTMDDFFDRPDRFPNVSLQGWQMLYNRRSGRYNRVVEAQGHMGKNGSYPGAAQVWGGNDLFFKEDPKYELVNIE